jgi:thiol:disulfide interchange protein DsbD
MYFLRIGLMAAAGLMAGPLRAAHTTVDLWLSAEMVRPGDTIWAGVDLRMEPGWHTYWKNPGDAGEATEIKWQLPPGVSAGEIAWPVPEKLPPVEVTTYGYRNEVVLLVPLMVASNCPAGSLALKAEVKWLECNDVCLPEKGEVAANLKIGSETKAGEHMAMLNDWRDKLPKENAASAETAHWERTANADERKLVIDLSESMTNEDFFPEANASFDVAAPTILQPAGKHWQIVKSVKKYEGDWPGEISGLLVATNHGTVTGFSSRFHVSGPDTFTTP